MIAEINGIKIAYSDTGPPVVRSTTPAHGEPVEPRAGPTVLLVHGYPLNRSMWDPQLGALRPVARVIAPDLRGFGASEGGPPGPLTVDQHADDLAALLDALSVSEPVIYCGLSMGGYVGFAFWRRHRRRVRAFVLADTRATADPPLGVSSREELARQAEDLGGPQPAIDAMKPRLFSPTLRAGSPAERITLAMMAGSSARAVADGARGLALRTDSTDMLASIDVPTLVIVGEHDQLTPPADSDAMLARLPNARLERIDQAGHMANLENPDQFNEALIEFVRTVAATPAAVSRDGADAR
ncbi:MAG TPA: alpha/beta fold hydrolase [Chloroflexota bacterium]|jgi:pimeloyl-ACP methyl ester carboxylesterase